MNSPRATDEILFSIVVPTYNRAELLEVAIKSVQAQTYPHWELLILDDGSTDATSKVGASFEQVDTRIRYFSLPKKERSTARNIGIENAKGQYICFLDDDDWVGDLFLENFYLSLKEYAFPQDLILRTGMNFVYKTKTIKGVLYNSKTHKHPVHFAAYEFCSACTLCIPKVCLLENRFPTNFYYWEDTHLILRLLAKYRFIQLSNHNYFYRQHEEMSGPKIYSLPNADQLVENNTDAMRDLFSTYGEEIKSFLPEKTEKYLIAEKYLNHAGAALDDGYREKSWRYFKKSIDEEGCRFFYWQYLKYLIKWTIRKF